MKKCKLTKKDFWYLGVIFLLVIAIAFLSVFLYLRKQNETYHLYYDKKCASYAVQNANLSKNQIIFIGDSITDLYPLDDFYADLDKAVYNRGIGGDFTRGVLDRLQVSLFDLQPSKVVLMIGTNDINWRMDNDTILANYREILTSLKTNLPASQVYCMSVIPQNDDIALISATQSNELIMQLNSRLQPLVEEFGYTYLNLFPLLANSENYLRKEFSDDGLHLNYEGFKVWTSLVKPYLQ